MRKTFLVGFDGSSWARSAVTLAGWLAKRTQAEVTVLHAVALPEDGPDASLASDFRAGLLAVDRETSRLRHKGVRVDSLTVVGEPVRRIMRAIEERQPALVVLGTLGMRPFDSWLLGSVATRVARASPVPVLLVPEQYWEPPLGSHRLKVLLPMDGSAAAMAALEAVESLGHAVVGDVTMLEVVDHPRRAEGHTSVLDPMLDGQTYRHLVQISRGRDEGQLQPGVALQIGEPATQIIQFSHIGDYDLIVLTKHGQGGSGMLLGSVAQSVIERTTVPVLIVPPAPAEGSSSDHELTAVHA